MLGFSALGEFALGEGPSPFPPVPVFLDDGAWAKRKRKRAGPDLIDQELAERTKRRAALELAIYGPEVVDEPEPAIEAQPLAMPAPNVDDLARAIVQARNAAFEAHRKALEQDDEEVLEMILKDLG